MLSWIRRPRVRGMARKVATAFGIWVLNCGPSPKAFARDRVIGLARPGDHRRVVHDPRFARLHARALMLRKVEYGLKAVKSPVGSSAAPDRFLIV